MSSTSDTSAIDEKKEENQGLIDRGDANYGQFFTNMGILILIIVVHFSLSGLVLYGCKIAQSNILPTEGSCMPYTNEPIKIDEIKCNIFNTLFTDPATSMKITFPYNKENSRNLLIDLLRKYKMSSKVGPVPNYFISIVDKLLLMNFSSYNVFLNFLNNAPEILNVFIGPIIVAVFTFCLLLFNVFYTMYLWFSEMKWFFRENSEKGNNPPKWSEISYSTSKGSYITSILLTILFIIIFFVGFPIITLIPMAAISWVLICIATYGSRMNINKDGSERSTNSFTVIKELFADYKVAISAVFSIFMVLSAFANLGNTQGFISLVVLIMVYLGVISIDIFKPVELPAHLTPLVSYDQANKDCLAQISSEDSDSSGDDSYWGYLTGWLYGKNATNKSKPKKGFLYNLIYGQNGGSLKKELKKLAKQG